MNFDEIAQFYFIVWIFVFLGWQIWTLFKISQFENRSKRQKAISRPQLRELRNRLLKGTLLMTVFVYFAWLLLIYGSSDAEINIVETLWVFPICFPALMIFILFPLLIRVLTLESRGLPMTNLKVVPIPKPPPPPPHAGKSFDQLSNELDESLRQLNK